MSIADELIAILGYEVTGEKDAKRFEKNLDGLNKKLDSFATNAGKIAGYASLAVASGFGLLGKSVIETSARFESYQATLETIEGSAEKARASLDWISEFGKTTPYDVAQVTDAFVKLKAYGIDPLADDALRVLGDTASAMGKPLEQAVEAFADAATGEFERLKEFGVKAKTQGDNVTFAWTENGKELTKTVKKNSNEIRAFLLDTLGGRFSGAMDRQSRTWNGMMSNLGDTWTDFKRRIGEAGFFGDAQANLQKVLDYLGKLDADGTLDRWAENISDALSKAMYFVELVAGRIVTNITFIAEHFDKLEQPLMVIGAVLGFLIARAFPLITIFSVLALAVDDFLSYLQGGESFIGDFIEKIKELTGVSDEVAKALAGLGGAVAAAMATAFLLAPFKILGLFAKGILATITKLGPMIFRGLMALIPIIAGRFAAMRMAMLAAVTLWGPAVMSGLAALGPLIMKGAAAAFALLSNPVGWAILLAGAAAGLIYYFWGDIKAAWDATSAKVVEIFSSLKDWILNIDWAGVGTGIMSAMWGGMKSIGEEIKAWFLTLIPDWAKDFIGVGDEGPGAQPNPNAGNITPSNKPQADKSLPTGQSGSVALTNDALDAKLEMQRKEWERVTGNLNDNLAKMVPDQAVNATITDSRQDNRQAPVNSNVIVNQTVQQASQAPRAAANATGNAVAGEVAKQRSQLEMEPSF